MTFIFCEKYLSGWALMPVNMFFCYTREDEALLNKLKTHLRPLQRQGLIGLWDDREIQAGANWEQEIMYRLNDADLVLLLVSSDFMGSDYCYGKEMKLALERHAAGKCTVIPVILRPVYWHGEPLGGLQALPTDGKPITGPEWHTQDDAFYDVVVGVEKVIKDLIVRIQQALTIQNNISSHFHEEESTFVTESQQEILNGNTSFKNYMRKDAERIYFSLAERVQKDFEIFDQALRQSFPGRYGYIQAKDRKEVDRLLNALIDCSQKGNLWWSQGLSSNPCSIKQATNNIWLLDTYECDIKDLWVYRSRRIDRQHAIVHLASQPPFDINDNENIRELRKQLLAEDPNYIPYDEAAFFKGRYIKRSEYDDGYATINDEIVELDETAEVRSRILMDDFIILTPQFGPSNDSQRDREIEDIIKQMRSKGCIDYEIVKILPSLEPLTLRKKGIFIDF